MNITKEKPILSHHDFQNKIIKLFDPDCIEIGLIVNVAPGAPGSGERRKEICLIHSIFKGQFWKMTPYVMNGRLKMLWCLFRAWSDLAIALCLPDECANHYIWGKILKLALEILLSEFLISLDFCTEGYFTKFCLIEKIILSWLICLWFYYALGTTMCNVDCTPNMQSNHKQMPDNHNGCYKRLR